MISLQRGADDCIYGVNLVAAAKPLLTAGLAKWSFKFSMGPCNKHMVLGSIMLLRYVTPGTAQPPSDFAVNQECVRPAWCSLHTYALCTSPGALMATFIGLPSP